jgi:hypothetical protein
MLGSHPRHATNKPNNIVRKLKNGQVLGQMAVSGQSSGGHIFAGTTTEALDQAATQLADYLLRNRKI